MKEIKRKLKILKMQAWQMVPDKKHPPEKWQKFSATYNQIIELLK